MKKIILIEDRISRQERYAENSLISLTAYDNLNNVLGYDQFSIIKKYVENNEFSFAEKYDVIIIHRSAIDQKARGSIVSYCKKRKKGLVFFSGGISSSYYSEDMGFPFLNLNSKELYSNNLVAFLKEAATDNLNLMILAFGNKWRLNLLLNFNIEVLRILNDPAVPSRLPKLAWEEKVRIPITIKEILKQNNYDLSWTETDIIEDPLLHLRELKETISQINKNIILNS